MGMIPSMLGFGNDAGGAGMNFTAQGTQLQSPVQGDMALDSLGAANQALASGQGGIDQQALFNNQMAGTSNVSMNDQSRANQLGFLQALDGQNGIGNQNSVFAQQQGLANQLQGVANGTGPNPALAQLNQSTAQNIANQAALMAGQRGASANVGLMGRQAAMQGGALQQQAAGQAATMQAQQQLNAMGALSQQQAQMGSLANNQIANRMGQGQAYANQTGTMVNQEQNALNAYNNALHNQQGSANQLMGNTFSALQNQNANNVAMQGNVNNANASVSGHTAEAQAQTGKGIFDNVSKLGQAAAMAHGGVVQTPHHMVSVYAKGGEVNGPRSNVGKHLHGKRNPQHDSMQTGVLAAKDGAMVPGKAKVKGDSLKNDTVPAVLSPGEVVIPRSVMMSKNPAAEAAKFVQAILAKKGKAK